MNNPETRKDELQRKRDRYIPKGIGNGNDNMADYARGAELVDTEGGKWIDFAGAIGTLNVGHSHPKVTEAVKKQTDRYLHPGFNVIMYAGQKTHGSDYVLCKQQWVTASFRRNQWKYCAFFNSACDYG